MADTEPGSSVRALAKGGFWSGLFSRRRLSLGGLLLAAALVRFYQLGHELPYQPYVDSFKFVGEALRIAGTGVWSPELTQYPGFFTNSLALLFLLIPPADAVQAHIIAQMLAALSGVGMVLMTWLLAGNYCGFGGQALAGLLSSLAMFEIIQSRTPAPDTLLGLCCLAFLWLCTREGVTGGGWVLAGGCVGAAIGTKFTGLYLLPFLALAVLWWAPGPLLRKAGALAASLAAAACVFTLSTPWFWSELPRYLESMRLEYYIQTGGQIGRVQHGWFDYWFSMTPTWELPMLGTSLAGNLGGPVAVLLLIAAILPLAVIRRRREVFLALFVLMFIAGISGPGKLKAYRFLLPVLPAAYVLLGIAGERLAGSLKKRQVVWFWVVMICLVMTPSLLILGRYVRALHAPTTLETARDWMLSNLPGQSVLFSPFFTDVLADEVPLQAYFLPEVGARQYRLPEAIGPSPERMPIYRSEMLAEMRQAGIRYWVSNSYFDNAFLPVRENVEFFPESTRNYQALQGALDRQGQLLFEVAGWDAGRLGPDIKVYAIY